MRFVVTLAVVTLSAMPLVAQTSSAQPAAPRPTTAGALVVRLVQGAWSNAKRDIVESADQMPEANYAYKPVDSVRTFGQILAHVADSNYFYCARAKGETAPSPDGRFEKEATTKAAIVKALADSVAYCDGVYGSLTEASVTEMVTPPGAPNAIPRAQPLFANASHNVEHYGNLVTYFRMKGMVPPSTKRAGGA
jgi:uncharacterized damage-inducible protein DinB